MLSFASVATFAGSSSSINLHKVITDDGRKSLSGPRQFGLTGPKLRRSRCATCALLRDYTAGELNASSIRRRRVR